MVLTNAGRRVTDLWVVIEDGAHLLSPKGLRECKRLQRGLNIRHGRPAVILVAALHNN